MAKIYYCTKKNWLFRFPLSKPEICQAWVKAVGKQNFSPTGNSRICSEHFDLGSYFERKGGKWELKSNAVPMETLVSYFKE